MAKHSFICNACVHYNTLTDEELDRMKCENCNGQGKEWQPKNKELYENHPQKFMEQLLLVSQNDKPIKIVFEGKTKIVDEEDKFTMNMELLYKIGKHNLAALDCSNMYDEEIDRIIEEFNNIPEVYPIKTEDLKKALEMSKNESD